MPEHKSENQASEWLIAPETNFARPAIDAAQIEALKSEGFLQAKSECNAILAHAFKNADTILTGFIPRLIDPALPTDAFKNSLIADNESYGELHGRKGITASRADRAKRKDAIKAASEVRRAVITLKRAHHSIHHNALARIETARRNASIGIPRLSSETEEKLIHLYGLEAAELEKAVSENAVHIAEIDVFHTAVNKRFGLYHQIFGDRQRKLTDDQLVHFEVLNERKQQIKQAQALIRALASFGDDEPLEFNLEHEWDREWDHGR